MSVRNLRLLCWWAWLSVFHEVAVKLWTRPQPSEARRAEAWASKLARGFGRSFPHGPLCRAPRHLAAGLFQSQMIQESVAGMEVVVLYNLILEMAHAYACIFQWSQSGSTGGVT